MSEACRLPRMRALRRRGGLLLDFATDVDPGLAVDTDCAHRARVPELRARGPDPLVGHWRAVAQLPGGELPFFIDIEADDSRSYSARRSRTATSACDVERVQWDEKSLLLDFPAFDNHIVR